MEHPGDRVARREGVDDLIDRLATLSPSDRASVLLALMARCADGVRGADLMARYGNDRFVRPSAVAHRSLRLTEDHLLAHLGDGVDLVLLAPTVPFGTHRALGATPQDNVVSTVRVSEVAADATNGLALEAATRRRSLLATNPRSANVVDLATVQRVTRGQRPVGPNQFAHFGLAARVTAGRDVGNQQFESDTIVRHIMAWRAGLEACGIGTVAVTVTDFSGRFGAATDRIVAETGATIDPSRERGRGYYDPLCFQIDAVVNGERIDVGDGGVVGWGATLLSNAKERMTISGIGVDRVTALVTPAPT
jgi:hypothetical protein